MTIAATPKAPYYAAIFSSFATGDAQTHGESATHMVELVIQQPGFLGLECCEPRADRFSVFISYWRSEEDIRAWKQVDEHLATQEKVRRLPHPHCKGGARLWARGVLPLALKMQAA